MRRLPADPRVPMASGQPRRGTGGLRQPSAGPLRRVDARGPRPARRRVAGAPHRRRPPPCIGATGFTSARVEAALDGLVRDGVVERSGRSYRSPAADAPRVDARSSRSVACDNDGNSFSFRQRADRVAAEPRWRPTRPSLRSRGRAGYGRELGDRGRVDRGSAGRVRRAGRTERVGEVHAAPRPARLDRALGGQRASVRRGARSLPRPVAARVRAAAADAWRARCLRPCARSCPSGRLRQRGWWRRQSDEDRDRDRARDRSRSVSPKSPTSR